MPSGYGVKHAKKNCPVQSYLYEKFFNSFKPEIVSGEFVEKFLNITLDTALSLEKDKILQIHYKAIRDALIAQSKIIQKIETLKQEVLPEILGKSKPPRKNDRLLKNY